MRKLGVITVHIVEMTHEGEKGIAFATNLNMEGMAGAEAMAIASVLPEVFAKIVAEVVLKADQALPTDQVTIPFNG
jgi:uncharacterized lipoprotein YajG